MHWSVVPYQPIGRLQVGRPMVRVEPSVRCRRATRADRADRFIAWRGGPDSSNELRSRSSFGLLPGAGVARYRLDPGRIAVNISGLAQADDFVDRDFRDNRGDGFSARNPNSKSRKKRHCSTTRRDTVQLRRLKEMAFPSPSTTFRHQVLEPGLLKILPIDSQDRQVLRMGLPGRERH